MKHSGRTRQQGLTLIELMVVVAVMAVIAAIAYPLYTNQVQKARRADAKVALESLAMAQERYFTINGEYGDEDDLAAEIARVESRLDRDGTDGPDDYTFAIDNTNVTFTITATATGAQAGDTDCASFTINHAGVKGASDSGDAASDKCW